MSENILAIDQGTTSTRAYIFAKTGKVLAKASKPTNISFPQPGWVEQDALQILKTTLAVCKEAIATSDNIAGIGITNQRETTIVWDKKTGEPVYPAINWQDRRTADRCQQLKQQGLLEVVQQKTGLLIDPYFSASKLAWILDKVDPERIRAKNGELLFGTIDSFLIWHLTSRMVHATDITNASRTMLYNIHSLQWDQELLEIFDIPQTMLPMVKNTVDDFGATDKISAKNIPITAVVGDQQSASIGQACFTPGMVKATFGTGCFALLNVGNKPIVSKQQLLTTIAYGLEQQSVYAIEGSVFVAGAAFEWLRKNLRFFKDNKEIEDLIFKTNDNAELIFVPAFAGLGAPHWIPDAKGAIFGLTQDVAIPDIMRAAIDAVCFQTYDLLQAMQQDFGQDISEIRVDGGMVKNKFFLQRLADLTGIEVVKPKQNETTVLGAAILAAFGCGIYDKLLDATALWEQDEKFIPKLEKRNKGILYDNWQNAVAKVRELSC